jgi:hypothetical protein
MAFGRNFKRRDGTKAFADFLGLYWTWIYRLGKKIGSQKFLDFLEKKGFSGMLSFGQVYEFTSNNLQKNQQGL